MAVEQDEVKKIYGRHRGEPVKNGSLYDSVTRIKSCAVCVYVFFIPDGCAEISGMGRCPCIDPKNALKLTRNNATVCDAEMTLCGSPEQNSPARQTVNQAAATGHNYCYQTDYYSENLHRFEVFSKQYFTHYG